MALLTAVCGGQEDLWREVEPLLAQRSADGILDRPAWEPEAGGGLLPDAARLTLGQRVSHYQIQETLGEVVILAVASVVMLLLLSR